MISKKGEPVHFQYSEVLRRPDPNDPTSVHKLPGHLVGKYLDPEQWAYSTLPPCDSDTLVKVHEIKQGHHLNRQMVRQRMWLHELLDDNGIPYQVEIKGYWAARKIFSEAQFIYVEEANEKTVRRFIKEYNDPDNLLSSSEYTDSIEVELEDGIPQKTCTSCGERIDFDYHKCPHCKAAQ